jgi:hypothetical protein
MEFSLDWFKKMSNLPPFLGDDEVEMQYMRYLATITEDQFHGVRLSDVPGDVIVTLENVSDRLNPHNRATNLGDLHPQMDFDWTPNTHGCTLLARFMLEIVVGPNNAEALTGRFAETMLGRIDRHEWTMSFAIVNRWAEAVKVTAAEVSQRLPSTWEIGTGDKMTNWLDYARRTYVASSRTTIMNFWNSPA